MKKLTLILMILVFTGTVQAVDLGLVNPGFETGDFTGWTTWAWMAGNSAVVLDDGDGNAPYAGSYSARFHGAGDGAGGAGAYQLYNVNEPNIGAGALVTISGYVRTTGSSPTATLVIAWMPDPGLPDPQNREKGRVERHIIFEEARDNWTFGKVTGFVPEYYDDVKIEQVKFEIANHHWLGDTYFDNIKAEATAIDSNCLPDDPCNMLINESFECVVDDGQGHNVPLLWFTKTDLDACDVNDQVVTDGTALDGLNYWSLAETNEPNEGLYYSGYQGVVLGAISDANAYQIVVNLRNPGPNNVDVQVGFDFFGPPYENFWGSDNTEFVVPGDNTWYKYNHITAKWLGSNLMEARVGVRNGTIHIDKTAVYDIGSEPCRLAKRDAINEIGWFPALPGDLNEDCYVNFQDIPLALEDWLNCILDPALSACP